MELEVDALVVEAFETAKLDELPNSVVMFAEMIFASEEIRLLSVALVENKFVEVALVIVPLVDERLVLEIFAVFKFVIVALVIAALAIAVRGRVIDAFERSRLPVIVVAPAKFVVEVEFKFEVLSVFSCDV